MFQRIFHPTDLSELSQAPFAHALKIALKTQGNLEILHVDPDPDQLRTRHLPAVRDRLAKWGVLPAHASFADVDKLGLGVRKVNMTGTDPVERILAELAMLPEDLIVLGTHGRGGMDRWIHGEVAAKVSRLAHTPALFIPADCPGFVDRETGAVSLQRILVPVDQQLSPRAALQAAVELVGLLADQTVTIAPLHVGEPPGPFGQLKLPAIEGIHWESDLRRGDVLDQIVAAADAPPADLIALTTAGRHGFLDMLRGSTTEQLLRRARCPILALPASVGR